MKTTHYTFFAALGLSAPLFGCSSDSGSGSDDSGTSTGQAGSGDSSGTPDSTTGKSGDTESTGGSSDTSDSQTTSSTDASDTKGSTSTSSTGGSESSASTDGSASTGSSSGSESTGSSSGSAASSGSETGSQSEMPDLDMSVVLEDTLESIYTETRNISADDCAVAQGCLGGTGMRRLLRFDTITPNLGDADFHVGNPTDNPDLFELSECNGQWLFTDYAQYRLLDGDGNAVATGHKAAFALIDLARWLDDAGPQQYGFDDNMGISVGWADIYNAGLECQWVDITDVPAGDYVLELSINADRVVEESDYTNNILLVDVSIGEDSDIEPSPESWTCSSDYYGTDDGCDCGCGAFDPDCADDTVESCEFCDNEGACSQACEDIDLGDNSTCN